VHRVHSIRVLESRSVLHGKEFMDLSRKREIYQLLEACRRTDNSNLEAEKTAVIGELLAEVERISSLRCGFPTRG
jgi:hypothetical protein